MDIEKLDTFDRVLVLQQLLYTMDISQRYKLAGRLPVQYAKLFGHDLTVRSTAAPHVYTEAQVAGVKEQD